MHNATPFIPWLLMLASCSSPPKPPTVDESQKRPVNSQMAVELQVCRNDLQNTRILAAESGRLAESTTATLANLAARQQIIAAMQPPADKPPLQANSVFSVRFDFGSTRVMIPADISAPLIADAKSGWLQQRTVSRSGERELAGTLASRAFEGRDLMWDAAFEARLEALTPEEIHQAVRRHLDPARISIVHAGNFAKAAKGAGATESSDRSERTGKGE